MLNRMLQKKARVALFIAVCFFTLYLSSVSAEIYKWIDSNGRTQYSDQRPKDQGMKPIIIEVAPAPVRDVEEKVAQRRGLSETGSEHKKQDMEVERPANLQEANKKHENIKQAKLQRCMAGRKELALLSKKAIPAYLDEAGNPRLNWAFDTYAGERKYLSESDREVLLEKTEATIDDYCENSEDDAEQEEARKRWVRSEYCLFSRSRLDELQTAESRVSSAELRKQKELTEEYCDDSASTSTSDSVELEIFRKPLLCINCYDRLL